MLIFKHKFLVDAPLTTVAAFHSDTKALRMLTPPPAYVHIHQADPLKNNAAARFTIWFGPIPIHWTAVHENVTDHGFTDIQLEGPFKSWMHTHQFESLSDGKTVVRDQIAAEFGTGFPQNITSRVMWFTLPLLFRFRKWRTQNQIRKTQKN